MQLAEHIGVNQSTVSRVRSRLMQTHKSDAPRFVETKNGRTINVSKIGKSPRAGMVSR